jgi:hypothetical protein
MKSETELFPTVLVQSLIFAGLALSQAEVSQASPLVGVNFSAAGSHPTNWTALPSVVSPANDLIAEDGSVTNIDLSFAPVSLFSGTVNPSTVPIHTPSLAALDGNAFNNFGGASFIALYSDLVPNQDYYVWVVGARFIVPIAQNVRIFGSDITQFDQIGLPSSQDSLFFNDELGDSTRTLESYAKIVNASDGGTITIVVKGLPNPRGQTYTVSALAVQAVPEPGSLVLAGFGLIALVGCARYRNHALRRFRSPRGNSPCRLLRE